ncbi:MAG: ABC transporter ATP-binding protein [Bdellovibrionaceae bacterium]|nr:ABC transporter ATP-binding protein [Pseudobdellovibrionaceae bacterium]
MTENIIEVKNLSKSFGKNPPVLNDLNLHFKKGKFYALLGENGVGKSTLMRILFQNESITSGDVLYKGQSIEHLDNRIGADSFYLDESSPFTLNRSSEEWAQVYSNTYANYNVKIFDDLCKMLNIDPSKTLMSLSRGQKAKAHFALGAARQPEVYLLDEITAVLDIGSRLNIIRFLEREIKDRNCTVIMSSNIATELPSSNTHIYLLKEGQLWLDCEDSDLSNTFKKVLVHNAAEESEIIKLGGKFLHFNGNNSNSFIIKIEDLKNTSGTFEEDKRTVSIVDVMTYYTSGENI